MTARTLRAAAGLEGQTPLGSHSLEQCEALIMGGFIPILMGCPQVEPTGDGFCSSSLGLPFFVCCFLARDFRSR